MAKTLIFQRKKKSWITLKPPLFLQQHEDRYYEYYPNYVRPKRQRNVTDYYNYNLEDNIEDEQAGSEDNQDDDEIIGDPLFISYNVTFSEEATNDGLPFLSTNSQNLPIDNLNSQDQTVSPKNLQKSAKKIVLEVFWRIKVVFNRGKIKKKAFSSSYLHMFLPYLMA